MRRGHPGATARLTRTRFESLDYVTVASPYTGQRNVEHLLAELGVRRNPTLVVANYTSVAAVIAQTDFVVIAPSRVARSLAASHGLLSGQLPFLLPAFTVGIHWSARHEGNAPRPMRLANGL
jgi:DNA-binding transcriptional LysR family regulator